MVLLNLLQWPQGERPWLSYFPLCSSRNLSLSSKYRHLLTLGSSALFKVSPEWADWTLLGQIKLDLFSRAFIPSVQSQTSVTLLLLFVLYTSLCCFLGPLSLWCCQEGLIFCILLWLCFSVHDFWHVCVFIDLLKQTCLLWPHLSSLQLLCPSPWTHSAVRINKTIFYVG